MPDETTHHRAAIERIKTSFHDAAQGLHWIKRHPSQEQPALYYHGPSAQFGDWRWWNLEELTLPDSDWIAEDMIDEGFEYVRLWSDRNDGAGDVQL